MHVLLASLLALSGLHLANANPGSARVTQAPVPIPNLLRRQDDICPPGDYTVCPDGFGCCENGAPCTTIGGEPACDTGTCNGSPCGDSGLCCDAICSESLGTEICVHTDLATDDFDFDFTIPTMTTDDFFTSTFDFEDETTGAATATTDDEDDSTTSTPDETTEDMPTIATSTSSSEPTSDEEDDPTSSDETTTARPTQTIFSGGDDTSSEDDQSQGGGDGTDGAGMVSAKGAFGVLGAALIGGVILLR